MLWICINLRGNNFWNKWGGHVHPCSPRCGSTPEHVLCCSTSVTSTSRLFPVPEMHGLDSVSCRDVTWRKKWNLGFIIVKLMYVNLLLVCVWHKTLQERAKQQKDRKLTVYEKLRNETVDYLDTCFRWYAFFLSENYFHPAAASFCVGLGASELVPMWQIGLHSSSVWRCISVFTTDYLSELCTPVAQVAERQHLCSASRRLHVVPRIQLDTYGRRAFAVVGPTVWNALGNDLRDPDLSNRQLRLPT